MSRLTPRHTFDASLLDLALDLSDGSHQRFEAAIVHQPKEIKAALRQQRNETKRMERELKIPMGYIAITELPSTGRKIARIRQLAHAGTWGPIYRAQRWNQVYVHYPTFRAWERLNPAKKWSRHHEQSDRSTR